MPGRTFFIHVLLAFLTILGIWLIFSGRYERKRFIYLVSVWLCVPIFCIIGYLRTVEYNKLNHFCRLPEISEEAVASGVIDDISIKDNSYSVTLTDSEIFLKGQSFKIRKILTAIPNELYTPFIGEKIFISGNIYSFEAASNPGQFDAFDYYTVRGYDVGCKADYIIKDDSFRPGFFYKVKQRIYEIRCYLSSNLYTVLPAENASVMVSIITGDRGMLDKDIKKLYSEGGIAHILSISSLHITILGMGLFRLLMKVFSRLRLSVFTTLLIVLMYGCMTGFSVSTSRAIIMLSVMLLGKLLRKAYDMPSAIGLAAMIILLDNPGMLTDSGFLLSFFSVIGIYVTGEIITAFDVKNTAAKSVILSAGVWLFDLPIVLNTYYTLNPYSVLINLFVLPLMSVLLVAGFLAGVFGYIFLAGPLYYILEFYEKICLLEKKLPFATIVVGNRSTLSVFLYYAFLMMMRHILVRSRIKSTVAGKRHIFIILLCLTVIFIPGKKAPFVFCFLDVGQGDSIFFRVGKETFLNDCGSSNVSKVGEYRIIPFLKYSGVSEIDHLIISHSDNDHMSALKEFFEIGYPKINEVIFNVYDTENALIDSLKENGIAVTFLGAGDVIFEDTDTGGKRFAATVRAVSPSKEKKGKDLNTNSLVLEAAIGGISVLLTGDSDFDSEEIYIGNLSDTPVKVLKCAHHGSKNSTSSDFLAGIHPAISIISCSAANNYNHPSPELIERLNAVDTDVFITRDCGMIELDMVDCDSLTVKLFKHMEDAE